MTKIEKREYTYINLSRKRGRSSILITCPFCERKVVAYVWSLAGSGKKCSCGAHHHWLGGESWLELDKVARTE
jgi:hypothetical protein